MQRHWPSTATNIALSAIVLLLAGVAFLSEGNAAEWMKTSERRERLSTAQMSSPVQLYFDESLKLRYYSSLVKPDFSSLDICGKGSKVYRERILLHEPRVIQVDCLIPEQRGLQKHLVGIDGSGLEHWRYNLAFPTCHRPTDEYVISETSESLVLSNLGVISASAGVWLLPPPAKTVTTRSGQVCTVPLYSFTGAALPEPSRDAFFIFHAQVTLLKRNGGLYRLNSETGDRELLVPVATTLLGGYWSVQDIAMSRDQRFLYLAEIKLVRGGPSDVSFSVLNLETNEIVFKEVMAESRRQRAPRVLVSNDGKVGFSFINEDSQEIVLVAYQAPTAHGP